MGVVRLALKALDIYKMLPKKNCKECGYPTCLTFAMKLAAGKADADSCPYLDETTKFLLKGATRPPIQLVKLGVGERSISVGDEIVLYRHEKTFYHPPGIFFSVSDLWDRGQIVAAATRVKDEVFPRVGETSGSAALPSGTRAGTPSSSGGRWPPWRRRLSSPRCSCRTRLWPSKQGSPTVVITAP